MLPGLYETLLCSLAQKHAKIGHAAYLFKKKDKESFKKKINTPKIVS